MSTSGEYDLAVVGAGSAGFAAAIAAAEHGAQVVLIGDGTIGGTCVNVGCVPSKAMIRAVETLHQARTASRFAGIQAEAAVTCWRDLVRQKDALVASLRHSKYSDLLSGYKAVTYRNARAHLTDDGLVVDHGPVRASKIIVATGARPAIPAIPGLEAVPYLTSTTAMELEALPASLLVIGGGYIGCELGQMFARAGVRVTIATRRRLLPDAEPEISAALAGFLAQDGIVVRGGLAYCGIRQTSDGVALSATSDGQAALLRADRVLIATGRRPNTEGFGRVEGIALLANGGIQVDDRMRTSKPGVYAAGDVTGRDSFVYMAAYGARLAAENALNGDTHRYDANAAPAVVFTDPQVASVGLTQSDAQARGIDVKTATLSLSDLPRALVARDQRGLIKLVAAKPTGTLLGAHILAPDGADSIQTMAIAIKAGLTVRDLAQIVFPYLTTVEGLRLAAQAFDRDIAKLSCCA